MSYSHTANWKSPVLLSKNSSSHSHHNIPRHVSPLPNKYTGAEPQQRKRHEPTIPSTYSKHSQSASDQKSNPPPYTSNLFLNTPMEALPRRHQVPPLSSTATESSNVSHNFRTMSLGPGQSQRSRGSEQFNILSDSVHKSPPMSGMCHSSQTRPPEGGI